MGTRIAFLLGVLVVIASLIFYMRRTTRAERIRLCTWSNYYPEEILEDFTRKTGMKLELSYISSNEELLAKLKAGAGGFDVIQPSDYMVRQLITLGMLRDLDHSQLPYLRHVEEFYKNLPYDPGLKYTVPFTWGTTGIAINTERVKIPAEGVSWGLLFESPDPKHTSFLDDMREVFTAALSYRGKSINTKDRISITQAQRDIAAVKDKILMFTSEPKPFLLKEEITIAHAYSADGIQAHVENPKMEYFIPKEGGVIWTDNFAIPKTSPNARLAHVLINYFLDPENALKIALTNHLASPNKTAKARLPNGALENPNLYPPPEILWKMQFLEDPGEGLALLNRLWTELKTS